MTQPLIAGVGINHTTVPEGDVDALARRIDELAGYGCDFVEIAARRMDLVVGGRLNKARAKEVAAACAGRGVRYTLHAPHIINLMDEPLLDLQKDACRASFEVAGMLGAEVAVFHAGHAPRDAWTAGEDRLLAVEREALAEMGDVAAAHGVTMCVENLNPSKAVLAGRTVRYSNDPRRLAAQIATVGHPNVAATLDFQHGYVACTHTRVDFAEACLAMAPVTRHIHAHDGFGRPMTEPDAKEGDLVALGQGDVHMPLGWGDIDWDGLLPRFAPRPGTVFMLEIKPRYAREIPACIREAKRLAALVGTAAS
ncbi:MAG: sugar phosphate isomerase/epimerase family protein [Acetobacterales bacterium]